MTAQVLAPSEKDPFKITAAINQLTQGRSNAVGTVTLVTSSATSTLVSAVNCAAGSAVFMGPTTAHAAGVLGTTYIKTADVTKGQFYVTHSATTSIDVTFWYVALG